MRGLTLAAALVLFGLPVWAGTTVKGGPSQTHGTHCIAFPSNDLTCPGTDGCDGSNVTSTSSPEWAVRSRLFDAASDEFGTFVFMAPANLQSTTATARIMWGSQSATCDGAGGDDDVCWTLQTGSFAESEAWADVALGGTLVAVTDSCHTEDDMLVVAFPTITHTLVSGEASFINISRDIDGGNCAGVGDDDLAVDAEVILLEFCFEIDSPFSGE